MFVYADNAATTKLSQEALAAMMPALTDLYGNPSSLHQAGRESEAALWDARERIAACFSAKPREIYFTSGGTESDNWALIGTAMANQRKDFLGSVVHDICTSKPEEIHNRILRERLRLIKESEEGKLMMNPLLRKERMEGRKEGRALGREEGREIGKEEGIILGKNSGKKEVAENLLKTTSLSLETIANVTNLPIEEITTLKANI